MKNSTQPTVLCGITYLMLATGAAWWLAPVAVAMIGLGFYALHNTLQTNATQMTPEARGTAVALFSAAIYIGQTIGVAAAAFVFDRFTAVPLFIIAAIALPALAFWFARGLAGTGERPRPGLLSRASVTPTGMWNEADRHRDS